MPLVSSVGDTDTEYPRQQLVVTNLGSRLKSCVVVERNLSVAWVRTFTELVAPGVKALTPLVVSVTGFDNGLPEEVPGIRSLLDEALAESADRQSADSREGKRRRNPLTCQG